MRAALRAQRALLVGVSITLLSFVFLNDIAAADVMNIVALGASNTAGWGVGSRNAYPAQLEAMLRSRGYDAHVANAGVSFDTTSGMLGRVDFRGAARHFDRDPEPRRQRSSLFRIKGAARCEYRGDRDATTLAPHQGYRLRKHGRARRSLPVGRHPLQFRRSCLACILPDAATHGRGQAFETDREIEVPRTA